MSWKRVCDCTPDQVERQRARGRERMRRYYMRHRDICIQRSATYYRNNLMVKQRYNKKAHFKRRFGISLEAVQALIDAQGGKCPICSTVLVFGGKAGAHVDHDHITRVIRGVLCCNCNTGLGHFKDTPDLLRAAAIYLERTKC